MLCIVDYLPIFSAHTFVWRRANNPICKKSLLQKHRRQTKNEHILGEVGPSLGGIMTLGSGRRTETELREMGTTWKEAQNRVRWRIVADGLCSNWSDGPK